MVEQDIIDIPHTEEAWNLEMEKVEASPAAIAKKLLLLAKTGFILFQTFKGIMSWRKSKKKMAFGATVCLALSALIVIGGCIYKFTSKEIRPLVSL